MNIKKTILVTGGAGFVGSHLVEYLLKNTDNTVVSLDNYSTGREENQIKGATYIKGNTKNINNLLDFVPDLVFHLGEYARVEQSFHDMETVWEYNKAGTFAVLEFCRKHGVKIIYAGSSTKFGDGGLGRDQSPYAWTKATNTELIKNYGDWFGLPYAITYFYNVYGPREITTGEYATVIGIFKRKFEKKEALTVVSPGTQVRHFTHVADIVRGLVLVGEKGEGDEYGLGAEKEYSILEVAKLFGGEIKMLPERKGNRMDAALTIQKSKELGWEAQKNLEDYIHEITK
jgi:UDP-glucose 4-epimerase